MEETGEEVWVMRWESQQVVCQADKGEISKNMHESKASKEWFPNRIKC
ncbi:hypothetical protein EVA_15264 [gut metagenome]|uniref:Uncharacterized protein n=1 Tax=gut metagenome TaxID=749906 RepID=J9FNX4_9ZZZZ